MANVWFVRKINTSPTCVGMLLVITGGARPDCRRRITGVSSMSLVAQRTTSDVPAIIAAVVDERRVAGLTDNPCPMTPTLRADGRWRIVLRRVVHPHRPSVQPVIRHGLSACRQFGGRCAYEEVRSAG